MKLDPEIERWIERHQKLGCDLHDMALGLFVEFGVDCTYDALQKQFKSRGWKYPFPRGDRSYMVGRGYEGIKILERKTMAPLDNISDLWDGVKKSLIEGAKNAIQIARENVPTKDIGVISSTDGDVLQKVVEEAVSLALDRIGIKDFSRPVYKDEIEDLPDSAFIVVLNDHHIPYHDPDVISLTTRFIRDTKPTHIVINGDVMDCKPLSRFDKGRFGHFSLSQEANQVKTYLKILREATDAEIIFVPGNHEFRIDHYVRNNAPELAEMDICSLPDLLGLKDLNITLKDAGFKESYIRFDNLYVGHWNKVNKHAGYTAKNLMADISVDFIQAHVHRAAVHYKRFLSREQVGIENGCLCQLDPHFSLHSDWQHAFSIVTKVGKKYFPQLIKITNGEFIFDGHLWKTSDGKKRDGILN